MTEIYKIEDEFSVCDKNCKYLNTCLDTYVDYYKNVNPYDTQLILAKSNIGNEINDMEEIDYLDYFDQKKTIEEEKDLTHNTISNFISSFKKKMNRSPLRSEIKDNLSDIDPDEIDNYFVLAIV